MSHRYDMALETKSLADDGTFEGYASTFGNIDQGGDVVEPGAFIESIVRAKAEGRSIPMLWNHDDDRPLGVWGDMSEDSKGLFVTGALNMDVQAAREKHSLMKQGAIGGLSIGYRVPTGGAEEDTRLRNVRRLKKIDLREISIVTMPMNIAARFKVKAEGADLVEKLSAGDRLTERELEQLFKSFGLSNSQAERAVRLNLRGPGEPAITANDEMALLMALKSLTLTSKGA